MSQRSMQQELDWIDKNLDKYDSVMHAESVKRNIEKRYRILELESHIKQLEKDHEA